MIYSVECSDPSYKKISESGILNKILVRASELKELRVGFVPDSLYSAIEAANVNFMGIGSVQKREVAEEMLLYRKFLDMDSSPDAVDSGLVQFPAVLGHFVLGDDLFRFRELEFPTRRSLEEAVTGYCLKEINSSYADGNRVWRNNGKKNEISRNIHGDLHVCQTDVSGDYRVEETLFGQEESFYSMIIDPKFGCFGAHQDWSGFLMSLLRYAEFLGKKDMPEIVNWREFAKDGGRGGNWADGHSDFGFDFLMERQLLGIAKNDWPISISAGCGDGRVLTVPTVIDGKLVYLRGSEDGEMESPKKFIEGNVKKVVEYDEKDLAQALIANYHYFARDRVLMCKIMEKFSGEK